MKKALVFLMVFTFLASAIMSAYADSSVTAVSAVGGSSPSADEKNVKISKDKAKEIALKFFKDNLGLDIDVKKFNSSIELRGDYQEPGQKVWTLSWRNYDGNKNINLNATINADDGAIYRISSNESYRQKTSAVAQITEAKAKEIADGFIKKVNPDIEKELKYEEKNYPGYMIRASSGQVTYNLRYVRIVNNVKFPNNYVNVGIDGITGKVKSYDYRWVKKDKLQFPALDKAIGDAKAYDILNSNADLELSYTTIRSKIVTPGTSMNRKLVYTGNKYNGLMIDAKDGNLLSWDGTIIDNNKKKDISKAEKDKILAGAKAVVKASTEMTELQAREIMEKEIKKLASADCKIDNIRYTENDNEASLNDEKSWDADFSKNPNAAPSISGSISIDATTGILRSFYCYDEGRGDESFVPKLTIEQAYDRAISFISEYYPSYINKINTEQILRNETNYDENGKQIPQRYLYFTFPRIENGVVIGDDYVNLSFDAKTGSLNDITCTWDNDITVPKLEGLIDKNKAKKTFFDNYKPELQYMSVNKPDANGNAKPEIKLVYSLKPSYILGIDAKSGKLLDYEGNEIVDGEDGFSKIIKGHKLEKELSILASQGIIDKRDFKLDKQVTRLEAVKMLVNARGNFYGRPSSEEPLFTDIKKTDAGYGIVQLAISYGILDNKKVEFKAHEKLTREELAELIIKGMGYDKVAKAKIAFSINSKDIKKIDSNRIGYVALCRGMGIMEDIKGNFEPKANVNIIDASAAIYKAISSLREVK